MDAIAPSVLIAHPALPGREVRVPLCSLPTWERAGWHEQTAQPSPEPETPDSSSGAAPDAPSSSESES